MLFRSVGVGIALAGGIDAAIALGVGDALGDADVGLLGRLVVAVDGVGVAHAGLVEAVGRGEQEIGGASWRERVWQYVEISVVAVSFTKNITRQIGST